MALERELKLTGTLPNLAGINNLAGVKLEYLRVEKQHNTYYDLPNLTLRFSGKSLRLRRVEHGEGVFTFKGASTVQHGWHQKQEIEVPAYGATSIAQLQDPEILAQLEGIALEALVPICHFDTTRQVFHLEQLGELCLDEVQVKRNQTTIETFSELELEALPNADETKLQQVAQTLIAMGRLEPSQMSKSARALMAMGNS